MISNDCAMDVAPSTFLTRCGDFFFRYRDTVFPLFFIPLLLLFPPALDYRMELLGLSLAFIGQSLRTLTVGMEYIIRGGLNKQVYADNLVTGGLFAHCRNPLYVGNILMVFALLVMANNPWDYLLGGTFILFVYVAIVAAEERFLTQKFGSEFTAYCHQVKRWLPSFKGLKTTLESSQFNWRRVLVKEYSSFYFWCFSAIALLTYATLIHVPFSHAHKTLLFLLLAWILSTLFFLSIRALKKNGQLTEDSFQWVPSSNP